MQEKQIVMVRYKEDRDRLINKLKYPTIVYCTGPEPHLSEIPIPNIALETYGFAKYLVDNYDNLPEYTIFSQADPDPHVESFELAIDSTFTSGFGSFCYARSYMTQYTSNWSKLLPLKQIINDLGIFYDNDNNCSKIMFPVIPGVAFYVSKERIRQRPKLFYQKMLEISNDEYILNLALNHKYPLWYYNELNFTNPELNGLSREEKLRRLTTFGNGRPGNITAGSFEALWWTIFQSIENLEKFNKKQKLIGNTFSNNTFDKNFFLFMENDWFKWDCPYYLKWREKLIEKTIWEGQQRGFDGKQLLEIYERVGYKHISL